MVLGYLLISSFRALSPRRYSYIYLSLWCISFEDSFDRKNYEIYKKLFGYVDIFYSIKSII